MSQSNDVIVHMCSCDESARVPTRGSPGAVGYDLYANDNVRIPPRGRQVVGTGIRMMIPSGMYGRIAPRSGLAVHRGIGVGAGVIDPDYRGEIKVLLFNHSDIEVDLLAGSRIAQIVFERVELPRIEPVTEEVFDSIENITHRGTGGFGSTGR